MEGAFEYRGRPRRCSLQTICHADLELIISGERVLRTPDGRYAHEACVERGVRFIRRITPAMHPPAWVEQLVREEIPAKDDHGLIRVETRVRFAQTCSALPNQTPKPYFGVGDDATIGAEWDIGRYHIGIQVGNNPAVDSIIFEVDRGEPEESDNVGILPALMLSILPD